MQQRIVKSKVTGGIIVSKLEIQNISMTYHTKEGETSALSDINLKVEDGEFITIIGPSGCGKSTLLSIFAGLIEPSNGKILIDDKEIKYPCSQIGYMLQRDHLFEWRTIYKNIIIGLEIQNKLDKDSIENVENMMKKYGLSSFKNYYPHQLSGGMRQRAALIRTLALNPEVLLLDEPFSALDYQTRLAVSDEIYCIIKNECKTAIMVSHDIAEAISLSDKIVVLTKRPGSVKSIHDINLEIENRTPLKAREAPKFREYFNTLWKELDVHVE